MTFSGPWCKPTIFFLSTVEARVGDLSSPPAPRDGSRQSPRFGGRLARSATSSRNMPGDSVTPGSSTTASGGGKMRGMAAWRRGRSDHGAAAGGSSSGMPAGSISRYRSDRLLLPDDVRNRLHELFGRIEQEFEKLYAENASMQDKVCALTERLDSCLSMCDKPDAAGGTVSGAAAVQYPGEENGQKPSKKVSQLSQKLKSTYKTSTSRIASTFKNSGCGQYVRDFRCHSDGVWEVNVSKWPASGQRFIGTASADFTAKVWSADSGIVHLDYYGHHGSVNSIRFHPFSDFVVTGSGDQTAHVWRLQLSASATSSPPGSSQAAQQLAAAVGSSAASSGDAAAQRASDDEELDETFGEDLAPGGMDASGTAGAGGAHYAHMPLVRLGGHTDVVVAADWLCDGRRVVTASWDGLALVHDVERGDGVNASSAVDSLCGHENELTNVCTHPSQKLLLTSSKDLSLRLWDLRAGSVPVSAYMGHTASVSSAVFAPGDKIISGSNDRTVKLWDMRNMAAPYVTIRSDSAVNRLSVCPITGVIAVPHDNRHIRLYDMHGSRLGRLPRSNRQGHTRMVCSTAWAEDGCSLASSSSAGGNCNLYSSGFDRLVVGWHVTARPDAKESSKK